MKRIFNKKLLYHFLAFIIPVITISGYIFCKEVMTNGDFFYNGENFLVADMRVQYNYLYSYIHDIISGTSSIFYSFSNSIGGNMTSTIGYYLSSPFNILYGFVSKADIPLVTTIIHIIKLGLCSLFMDIYLTHKFGNRGFNLIFSISYAFIGFNAVYYFNAMWTDIIYMTPLVIMGIDKLIKGKPLMYIITLSLSIILNFYIAYMLFVFCIIYFLYELFIKYKIKDFKKYKKIIFKFILSSIFSILLILFFLIPFIINMKSIMRFPLDYSRLNINLKNVFNIFIYQFFSNIYVGSNSIKYNFFNESAIVYIGLFSSILVILYLFNKKIKLKERLLSLGIILFFVLSFLIPHLQLFWHGFTFPNGYNNRFAFLLSFFLILLAAKQFYSNEKVDDKKIKLIIFISFVLGSFMIVKNLNYLKNINVIVSVMLASFYGLLYYTKCRLKSKDDANSINLIIIVFVILEMIYNYSEDKMLLKDYEYKPAYKTFYNQVCKNTYNIDLDFYRVDGSLRTSNLDGFMCSYSSMSSELSTNNKYVYNFMYKNGMRTTYIALYYDFWKLPILESILGVRYIITPYPNDEYGYVLYKKSELDTYFSAYNEMYIYENPYALNLGFAVDDNFEKNYNSNNNRLENLNVLIKSLSGIEEDILTKLPEYEDENGEKYFYVDRDIGEVYFVADYKLSVNYSKHGDLYLNDNYNRSIEDGNGGIDIMSSIKKGDKLYLRVKNNVDVYDVNLYYFNKNNFEKAIYTLKENQLNITSIRKNKILSNIHLDKDSTIFISIPYDKGWHIYVDGKKVKYRKVADTFIAVDLKKGYHEIEMKFYPSGLSIGTLLSIISLVIVTICLKKKKL